MLPRVEHGGIAAQPDINILTPNGMQLGQALVVQLLELWQPHQPHPHCP